MKAILQVIGCRGAGKTTLSEMLIQDLSSRPDGPSGILAIDASPDMKLSRQLALDEGGETLAAVVRRFQEKPSLPNEAIDWAFNDLAATVGQDSRGRDIDLVTVGGISQTLPPGIEKMLSYGLNRMIKGYDFVIIDGEYPFFRRYLPEDAFKTMVVMTPEQWSPEYLGTENDIYRTPAVIINQCQERALSSRLMGELGQALDDALDASRIRLIGKLPDYGSQEMMQQRLPSAFHNCLLRLDLPFIASSSL